MDQRQYAQNTKQPAANQQQNERQIPRNHKQQINNNYNQCTTNNKPQEQKSDNDQPTTKIKQSIYWSQERESHPDRTKHIQIRTHFVKEYQEDGKINILFVKSEDNESDIFTKNTTNQIFNRHQPKLVWSRKEIEDTNDWKT